MDKHLIECVEWIDSRGVSPEWNDLALVRKDAICEMMSVGWVMHETGDELLLVPHVSIEPDGEHQVCGEMHIPKVCVTSRKELFWRYPLQIRSQPHTQAQAPETVSATKKDGNGR